MTDRLTNPEATDRRRMRRHDPPQEPLYYAAQCQEALARDLAERESERGRAFLSAANVGWSMREIADATGLSPSTVCRIINEAERG